MASSCSVDPITPIPCEPICLRPRDNEKSAYQIFRTADGELRSSRAEIDGKSLLIRGLRSLEHDF